LLKHNTKTDNCEVLNCGVVFHHCYFPDFLGGAKSGLRDALELSVVWQTQNTYLILTLQGF